MKWGPIDIGGRVDFDRNRHRICAWGKNQNAKYEWSPDNTLKIEDHLPYESAAIIRRCFATPMHFVEFETSKM